MPDFLKFLKRLICEQQDGDTVCEVATQVWFEPEPRELMDKHVTVRFEPSPQPGAILASVRVVNAETDETIETQRWAIQATQLGPLD